ncbi:MAG: YggS family pyridoxal phosphate-dependent enzyme [Christensenellales bacterium]|jgi:pyridoxal phosphate enzyme (YggS family)
MSDYPWLEKNIRQVKDKIARAAEASGKNPANIALIAVTKTVPSDIILESIRLGITDIGENRAQEWMRKQEAIAGRCRVHFIGQLQRNKVKYVVTAVDCVHSVDRPPLLDELERQCAMAGRKLDILLQVCLEDEPGKGGVMPDDLSALARAALDKRHLRLKGLMCVPPPADDPLDAAGYFARLRQMKQELEEKFGAEFPMLSMGMSHDYEVAIAQGATHVRVGTAIYGRRHA